MQTQTQHTSKKNKVTVPFYSPPCRLYAQTSADIIKEARAAVMTSSPVGIKPVFTSRPFTPNPNERTLFGNAKKNKSRPPSSFSLRHLKNKESNFRVKLPSIEVVSRKKDNALKYSKNLSLDNFRRKYYSRLRQNNWKGAGQAVTEDYDAEIFEEKKTADAESLPLWKKSHSCPKEGRLSRVASLNDIIHLYINENNCKRVNELNYTVKGNSDTDHCDNDLKENMLFGNFLESDENETGFWEFQQNSLMARGGGDYEMPQSATEKLKIDNKQKQAETKEKFFGKSNRIEDHTVQGKVQCSTIAESKEKKNYKILQSNGQSQESEEKVLKTKGYLKESHSKNENFSEKSVATDSKSDYLTSIKVGNKTAEIFQQPKSVPLEILELHETVRYYGVDLEEIDNQSSSTKTNLSQSLPSKTAENLNDCYPPEETIDKFNDNIKNETTNIVKKEFTTKSQLKASVQGVFSEYTEYEMNDKKRYHTVSDGGVHKEKAYAKWNKKQEMTSTDVQPHVSNDGWDLFWKNSYYQDKDEKNNVKADVENLQRLISNFPELIKTGADSNELYEKTSELFELIKNNKILLDSKLKNKISKALYLCVDNENANILLSLAKIFFLLKEENCLSVACKIIFKVARFDKNDNLFLNEEELLELFLEGIGRASPLDCAESCVYSYGALKFLTLNHNILSRILHMGVLDLMTLHLKMINNAYAENGKVDEQTQHTLFQLTGALRHVAAGEGAVPLFLTTNCISILCNSLLFFSKDEDVCINISRTLSLLSTDETVTQALMQVNSILTTLIDIIERYKENDKIVIRLAFCLGNIVEHNDLARVQLSRSDAALNVLLNVLKLYINKDLEISLKTNDSQNSGDLSSEIVDDVIVKVIRIIANMSMNPIVGSNLSPATKEKKSLQLSELLSLLLIRKDPGITLLATLGCLNNISYYCNTHVALIDITQGVERVLGLDSVECQIEAARVLGNLTRHREIRDLIYNTGGVDLLIKLLESPDQEIVRCACGALVNMLLDLETRKSFVQAKGIDKLVKTLELFPDDWSLASLAARAIWNSCGEDMSSAVLHNNMEYLLNILASSLEEEKWNDGDVAWEEFASVATDLLEKISSHLETV